MSAQETRAEQLARIAAQTDWSKVTDAYTGERYGPEVPAALWATDRVTAGDTCMDLRFAAIGDGSSVRGAAAELLPFLVAAARDPDVTVRFEILLTIADIADTGNTAPTAKVDRILEGRWRPTVDAAWPPAWERAAEELLPLLDDGDHVIRAGTVRALAQCAAHADDLIADFLARFDVEPDRWSAGCLVLGVGELARHATGRREEALAWLRHRMTVEGKGEEPDIEEDVDAWLAWDEEIRHDVRLQAVEALCRVLPEHADPLYAPVTTAALLASSSPAAGPYSQWFSAPADIITEADRRLGADLPGRLALAHALLRHDGRYERAGGLRIAAALISRWRSAVPALLPAVAERVSDTHPENRAFALRVLAMCGAAALPWADLVATHLAPVDEPDEATREHALWALSRMGDERCVPYLAELRATRGGFAHRPAGTATRGWDRSELSLAEALAPFAGPQLPDPTHQFTEPALPRACAQPGGPLGVPDADRLREMFHAALAKKPKRWSDAPTGAVERARELWRATGHAEDVLPALLELTARSALDVHQTPGSVKALALLAEVAATYPPVAERVARQLHATAERRIAHDNRFDAMATVRSLWQLTSDPQQVVPHLIDLVRICPPPGSADPTVLAPLRLLAEVRATDPASVAPAAPLLHALLDADERPVHHDEWRSVRDDEALRAAVRAVLGAG